MKLKKEVLYIIGIALICWVLIFTMTFLPYNKFEFSWLEQGIKKSTALLLGFAVMLCVLVYFQWKVYEEKCFSDWDIKKLLIITATVFLVKESLQRWLFFYVCVADIDSLYITLFSTTMIVPRVILYWLMLNIYFPIMAVMGAKYIEKKFHSHKCLILALWCMLQIMTIHPSLTDSLEWDLVKLIYCYIVISITYGYCAFIFFEKDYLLKNKYEIIEICVTQLCMLGLCIWKLLNNAEFIKERLLGFIYRDGKLSEDYQSITYLFKHASIIGKMSGDNAYIRNTLINRHRFNPIWHLLLNCGWLVTLLYVTMVIILIALLFKIWKNIEKNGLKFFCFCSLFTFALRSITAIAMSFTIIPIHNSYPVFPFGGYCGLYDVFLLSTCMLGSVYQLKKTNKNKSKIINITSFRNY